jgi:hypothetical protein
MSQSSQKFVNNLSRAAEAKAERGWRRVRVRLPSQSILMTETSFGLARMSLPNGRRLALLALVSLCWILWPACGNQNSTTPPIVVTFTPGFTPPATMATGGTAGIAATITNGPQNPVANWSVTCGSVDCGSFNPMSTASTIPTTYTAPATSGTVTVKATSANDATKSASASITVQ